MIGKTKHSVRMELVLSRIFVVRLHEFSLTKKHRERSPVYFKPLFKVPLLQADALTPSLLRPLASESSLFTLLLVSVDPAFFLSWLSVKTWCEEE